MAAGDEADYVIEGRRITGNTFLDDVGDPDIEGRFSPGEVARVLGGKP
jgi:hypothetical protein